MLKRRRLSSHSLFAPSSQFVERVGLEIGRQYRVVTHRVRTAIAETFRPGGIDHAVVVDAIRQVHLPDGAVLRRIGPGVGHRRPGSRNHARESRRRFLMQVELAVVLEPAAAGGDREVLGHVEADLAEHGALLELGLVTAQEPGIALGDPVAHLIVLQVVEVLEGRRARVVVHEAVERGMPCLTAVEDAGQPGPAALGIVARLQARLEGRDPSVFVVGCEAARVTAEIVLEPCRSRSRTG